MLLLPLLAVVLQLPSAPSPIALGHPPGACRALTFSTVAGMSGQRIGEIRVLARGPDGLLPDLGVPMHVITRDRTIRGRLLFAVGDTVDTLRVSESVRQLHRLRYLAGAVLRVHPTSGGLIGELTTFTDAIPLDGDASASLRNVRCSGGMRVGSALRATLSDPLAGALER